MSKSKVSSGLLPGLFSINIYKRTQGQRVRQSTALAIAIASLVAASSLSVNVFGGAGDLLKFGAPALVALMGCWFGFRIVNHPPAADFMIGVQAEMDKVSWPTWPQLWRATIVVLVVMVLLSCALLLFDVIWRYVFTAVGFLRV